MCWMSRNFLLTIYGCTRRTWKSGLDLQRLLRHEKKLDFGKKIDGAISKRTAEIQRGVELGDTDLNLAVGTGWNLRSLYNDAITLLSLITRNTSQVNP